jgi:pilus assembly protein Flp/PilA
MLPNLSTVLLFFVNSFKLNHLGLSNTAASRDEVGQSRTVTIGVQVLNFLVRAWRDRRGQDLIEYALMACFLAVAAGAVLPGVASGISTLFSEISSVMTVAASQS